jgi:tripartite-type tricarboxylate transporter receptor subunit TctC
VITIPTAEGGGADRDARNFTAVWQNHIDTNFEYEFYPGAAGQVGYEVYVGKKEPDGYNLLFANTGPEVIMQVLQKPPVQLGKDFVYFVKTSSEPMALWVGKSSPFETVEQLVDEGKKRVVTVSVSRLHTRHRSACSRSARRPARSSSSCPSAAATRRRWPRSPARSTPAPCRSPIP